MSGLLPRDSSDVDNSYTFRDAFQVETQPSYTYKLHAQRVSGYVDGLDAYKQAIFKLLNTERYEYIIYSWNYGVELKDLFGQHIAYVVPELERRIREAIMQDDRTVSVTDFQFDTSKFGEVAVKFKANSIFGETEQQLTVAI